MTKAGAKNVSYSEVTHLSQTAVTKYSNCLPRTYTLPKGGGGGVHLHYRLVHKAPRGPNGDYRKSHSPGAILAERVANVGINASVAHPAILQEFSGRLSSCPQNLSPL